MYQAERYPQMCLRYGPRDRCNWDTAHLHIYKAHMGTVATYDWPTPPAHHISIVNRPPLAGGSGGEPKAETDPLSGQLLSQLRKFRSSVSRQFAGDRLVLLKLALYAVSPCRSSGWFPRFCGRGCVYWSSSAEVNKYTHALRNRRRCVQCVWFRQISMLLSIRGD